jgi:acyl carrier protein
MRAKEKNKGVSGARPSPVREKRPLGLDDRELVEEKLALALLERIVTVEAAAILRRPISDIDPLRPLSEMGMDSLMAVELRLALESRLGVDVPLFPLAEDVAWIASRIEAATKALVEQSTAPFQSALDFLLQQIAERARQKNELAQVIPGASVGDMNTAAAIAVAARTLLGNGVKDLPDSVLGDLWRVVAAELEARETDRATGEPRRMTQAEIRRAKLQERLDGLQPKYEKRLGALELPLEGFTTKKQADEAAALATNLRDIQKLQLELGFPVTEWPDRVTEAESMASAYRRTHTKTGESKPRRPRGRPRRDLSVGARLSS